MFLLVSCAHMANTTRQKEKKRQKKEAYPYPFSFGTRFHFAKGTLGYKNHSYVLFTVENFESLLKNSYENLSLCETLRYVLDSL
jgi:hypothetical protein